MPVNPRVLPSSKSLPDLLQQVREGSDEAAWELVEEFGPYIQRAIRRRLPNWMRSKFDTLDFAQAIWASFFGNCDRIVHLNRPEQLIALLTQITSNKVIDEVRRRSTQKFDCRRETGFDASERDQSIRGHALQDTPSAIAMVRECWRKTLECRSPLHRRILELRQEGHTYDEIAKKLEISQRTVIRVVQKALDELLA